MGRRLSNSYVRIVGGGIVAMSVSACALFQPFDIPHAGDAEEASAMCRAVERSDALPPGAELFSRPGRRRTTLFVYRVRDAGSQDRVLEAVRAARERCSSKPVRVEFRTERTEHVVSRTANSTTSKFDHGELLRTEVIE